MVHIRSHHINIQIPHSVGGMKCDIIRFQAVLPFVLLSWTSFNLYRLILCETFYGTTISVSYLNFISLVEISSSVINIMIVVYHSGRKNGKYHVETYSGHLASAGAAIVGSVVILVYPYLISVRYPSIKADVNHATGSTSIVELHETIRNLYRTNDEFMLAEDVATLPHGSFVLVVISAMFVVAYTVPTFVQVSTHPLEMGAWRWWIKGTTLLSFIGQVGIIIFVIMAWIEPEWHTVEYVLVGASANAALVVIVTGIAFIGWSDHGDSCCAQDTGCCFKCVKNTHSSKVTDGVFYTLVGMCVSGIGQSITAVNSFLRDWDNKSSVNLYLQCTTTEKITTPACNTYIVSVTALTFRLMLLLYFVAMLTMRSIELSQLCRPVQNKEHIEPPYATETTGHEMCVYFVPDGDIVPGDVCYGCGRPPRGCSCGVNP